MEHCRNLLISHMNWARVNSNNGSASFILTTHRDNSICRCRSIGSAFRQMIYNTFTMVGVISVESRNKDVAFEYSPLVCASSPASRLAFLSVSRSSLVFSFWIDDGSSSRQRPTIFEIYLSNWRSIRVSRSKKLYNGGHGWPQDSDSTTPIMHFPEYNHP